MKSWIDRSIISGLLILIGQAIATLASVHNTDQFVPVLWIQIGAVVVGLGELIRRQASDPVQSIRKMQTYDFGDGWIMGYRQEKGVWWGTVTSPDKRSREVEAPTESELISMGYAAKLGIRQ